jgi:hypothetical protein
VTALRRSVTRFDPRTRERLDDLADQASADPTQLIEAIRGSLVTRGRKAR